MDGPATPIERRVTHDPILRGHYEINDPIEPGGPDVPSAIGSVETSWCLQCGGDVTVPIPGQSWEGGTKIHDCIPREHYPLFPIDATAHRGQDSVGKPEVYTFYENRADVPNAQRAEENVHDWDYY